MKKLGFLLVLIAAFAAAQDTSLPSQQIQIPPKPTCVVFLPNGSCADLWRQYNAAVLQQYVARQREAASAPLQQQIADLNKLSADQQAELKSLHEQMDAEAHAAAQAREDAHTDGLRDGVGYGITGTLFAVGLVFAIKRVTKDYSVTKKEHANAASA
jgi:hypothetical protein